MVLIRGVINTFFLGNGKFDLPFLDPALQFCTHLIYGYAGVKEENFNIIPLDESLDINKQNYKQVTDLKRRFPGLRVLLSVGGNRDISGEDNDKNLKYRTLVSFLQSIFKDHFISSQLANAPQEFLARG